MTHRSSFSALPCLPFIFIGCVAFALRAHGQFDSMQPYAEVAAGVQYLDSSSAPVKGFPFDAKVEFDTGYRAEAHFGYHFRKGAEIVNQEQAVKLDLALEVETGFSENEISTIGIDLSQAGMSFDLVQVPFLINVIFRLPINERMHVDVGGGAGAVVRMVSATNPNDDATSVGVGWDGFLKFGYDFSPHFSVGFFGKCIGVSSMDLPDTCLPAGSLRLRVTKIEDTFGVVGGAFASWIF